MSFDKKSSLQQRCIQIYVDKGEFGIEIDVCFTSGFLVAKTYMSTNIAIWNHQMVTKYTVGAWWKVTLGVRANLESFEFFELIGGRDNEDVSTDALCELMQRAEVTNSFGDAISRLMHHVLNDKGTGVIRAEYIHQHLWSLPRTNMDKRQTLDLLNSKVEKEYFDDRFPTEEESKATAQKNVTAMESIGSKGSKGSKPSKGAPSRPLSRNNSFSSNVDDLLQSLARETDDDVGGQLAQQRFVSFEVDVKPGYASNKIFNGDMESSLFAARRPVSTKSHAQAEGASYSPARLGFGRQNHTAKQHIFPADGGSEQLDKITLLPSRPKSMLRSQQMEGTTDIHMSDLASGSKQDSDEPRPVPNSPRITRFQADLMGLQERYDRLMAPLPSDVELEVASPMLSSTPVQQNDEYSESSSASRNDYNIAKTASEQRASASFVLVQGESEAGSSESVPHFFERDNELVDTLIKAFCIAEYRFKQFDKDGTGFIDGPELKHAMKMLGEDMTDQEVAEMIREADYDMDGRLSYEDFSRIILMK